jgi:hypothetical protein
VTPRAVRLKEPPYFGNGLWRSLSRKRGLRQSSNNCALAGTRPRPKPRPNTYPLRQTRPSRDWFRVTRRNTPERLPPARHERVRGLAHRKTRSPSIRKSVARSPAPMPRADDLCARHGQRSRTPEPVRASLCSGEQRLPSPDASHRLLQPTHATCTRASPDSREAFGLRTRRERAAPVSSRVPLSVPASSTNAFDVASAASVSTSSPKPILRVFAAARAA